MSERHDRRARGEKAKTTRRAQSAPSATPAASAVEVLGWTILAHPLFLAKLEKLIEAAERERSKSVTAAGPNAKLLAHVLDLAFDKIPRDPGNPAYRHGGTLGAARKHWFRAKTGNGRYRLFYRFQSSARLIVYVWLNDEESLRTYGSKTDAYAVFAGMLESGDPPSDWHALVTASGNRESRTRLAALAKRGVRRSEGKG